MTREELNRTQDAIDECERFISLAKEAMKNKDICGPCRKRSAMKRASLDLSESLAKLRKYNRYKQ